VSRRALTLLLLSLLPRASSAAQPAYFGQAQGHLEAFADAPLLAGNWEGRYRPYVLREGRLVSLLPGADPALADLDLLSPMLLAPDEILLSGTRSGHPAPDVYRLHVAAKRVENLTDSPDVDDGELCLAASARLASWAAGPEQRFARVGERLEPLIQTTVPAFRRCRWVGDAELFGVEQLGDRFRLHHCRLERGRVACERRTAFEDVAEFTDFTAGPGAIVTVRRRGDQWRRPHRIALAGASLEPILLPGVGEGDVLDYDGTSWRLGFESYYTASFGGDHATVLWRLAKIGGERWAIGATPRSTPALARFRNKAWELVSSPGLVMPAAVATPQEVWLGPSGERRIQAFYFGPRNAKKVVVWWHGGPHGNVSPRFNPYFQKLNELGFGVLAVNYPGSSGRGATFENQMDSRSLEDAVIATWDFLRSRGAGTVVSWSVSSGNQLQSVVLRVAVPVGALVDQVGVGPNLVLPKANASGIPYFGIRGRYDRSAPLDGASFVYEGGHDITLRSEFASLFDALGVFLAKVRPTLSGSGS
jgi:hypothetical protein